MLLGEYGTVVDGMSGKWKDIYKSEGGIVRVEAKAKDPELCVP
jgi:hypothetical protein